MKYDDSRGFYFSMSKDFSINKELPRVNFVKCAMQTRYGNNVKIEPQHERGFAQLRDYDTSQIY